MKKFIFILYFLFLLLFSIFSYAFTDANLQYLKFIYTGFFSNERLLATIIYILFISIFFIFYISFFILFKNNKLDLKGIKILIGLTIGALFLSYPAMLAYDIFNYLITAKVLFFYHENPYIIMPMEFIDEPFLAFTRAANKIALYGPSWELFSGIPYAFGFGNFITTVLSFKLFMVLFYIGVTLLIFKISKSIFSVLFFALNPLVVIETLVSSHNDIIMMFFALLSFWFIIKKKFLPSVFFLLISILIKYATIFLLPVFVYIFLEKYVRKKEINFEKVFYLSIFLMMIIFFLAPLREEIYPWYAIWFLTFVALTPKIKFILYANIIFSFSLLLGYTPYMFRGTYQNPTLVLKTIITFTPPILFGIYTLLTCILQLFRK